MPELRSDGPATPSKEETASEMKFTALSEMLSFLEPTFFGPLEVLGAR